MCLLVDRTEVLNLPWSLFIARVWRDPTTWDFVVNYNNTKIPLVFTSGKKICRFMYYSVRPSISINT